MRAGSFIVRFSGILHNIQVFRGNSLHHIGELHTNLVKWCVYLSNIFKRKLTTIVKLIIKVGYNL
jgi:hypothetical protein